MWSYWEREYWQTKFDCLVVGGGFSGLNVAIEFKKVNPKAKVLVLDKQLHFSGASTKNAGFACFGSPGEVMSDLEKLGAENTMSLIKLRWRGIETIRAKYRNDCKVYESCMGHELFNKEDSAAFTNCVEGLSKLNELLEQTTDSSIPNYKLLDGINGWQAIQISGEGQIDPVKVHLRLLKEAAQMGILIMNGFSVKYVEQTSNGVIIDNGKGQSLQTSCLVNCTNGFHSEWMKNDEVVPARAQVLITHELAPIPWQGNFHMDQGYTYFRNVGSRLLLGGGRNLDFEGETTTRMVLNPSIQSYLDGLCAKLLPGQSYVVDHRWTGIMGMRSQGRPGIRQDGNIWHLAGMSGMGVALSFALGQQLAEKL